MPPLDPYTDFQDDGGTPGWRARHPPQITVYPTMRGAFKDLDRFPIRLTVTGVAQVGGALGR